MSEPEKEEGTFPFVDLNQNPMIEIITSEKVAVFVKDIRRVEIASTVKNYTPIFQLTITYQGMDKSSTTWSWSNEQERNLVYEKIMNIMRGCFPVLVVK